MRAGTALMDGALSIGVLPFGTELAYMRVPPDCRRLSSSTQHPQANTGVCGCFICMQATVYILWNGGHQYYVGSTHNYGYRLMQHKTDNGAQVTRRWLRRRMPVLEYWKIELGINVEKSPLVQFESLVRQRLRFLFPECSIH